MLQSDIPIKETDPKYREHYNKFVENNCTLRILKLLPDIQQFMISYHIANHHLENDTKNVWVMPTGFGKSRIIHTVAAIVFEKKEKLTTISQPSKNLRDKEKENYDKYY